MTTEDAGQPLAAPNTAQQVAQPAAHPGYAAPSPYGAPQQGYAMPYGVVQPSPPRGLSIASMVCGIIGLVLCFIFIGLLPALAGVILGHIGLKKEPFGKEFSITGLITGYVGVALSLIMGLIMLAAILIPLLIASTMVA